jgi:hypothetical protein
VNNTAASPLSASKKIRILMPALRLNECDDALQHVAFHA